MCFGNSGTYLCNSGYLLPNLTKNNEISKSPNKIFSFPPQGCTLSVNLLPYSYHAWADINQNATDIRQSYMNQGGAAIDAVEAVCQVRRPLPCQWPSVTKDWHGQFYHTR